MRLQDYGAWIKVVSHGYYNKPEEVIELLKKNSGVIFHFMLLYNGKKQGLFFNNKKFDFEKTVGVNNRLRFLMSPLFKYIRPNSGYVDYVSLFARIRFDISDLVSFVPATNIKPKYKLADK